MAVTAGSGAVWVTGSNAVLRINPATNELSSPLSYGPPYDPTGRGFDDVAFDGKKVFLSETNPSVPGDSVIVSVREDDTLPANLTMTPLNVPSANTLKVRVCNPTNTASVADSDIKVRWFAVHPS